MKLTRKKLTLTRRAVMDTFLALEQLRGLGMTRSTSYAVARNFRALRPHADAIREHLSPPPRWQEYDEKRVALCREYADKDGAGEPVIRDNGSFVIQQHAPEFGVALGKLKDEYADALTSWEEAGKKADEFLDELHEDSPFKLFKLDLDDLPDQDVAPSVFDALLDLIDEGEVEIEDEDNEPATQELTD